MRVIALLFVTVFSYCNIEAKSNTFIFGQHSDVKSGSVSVSMITNHLGGEETIVETMVNEDGSFIVPLEISKTGIGLMSLGERRYYLYLEPGSRLDFDFDSKRDKALHIKGDDGASECLCTYGDEFLFPNKANSVILSPGTTVLKEHHENLKPLSVDERLTYIEKQRQLELDFVESCEGAPSDFMEYLEVYANGKWLSTQLRYVDYKSLDSGKKTQYHQMLKDLSLDEDRMVLYPAFGVFIDNYLLNRTGEAVNRSLDYFKDWAMLYEYGRDFMDELGMATREYMLTRLLFNNLNPRKADSMKEPYQALMASVKSAEHKELLQRKWDRAFKFAGGSSAPDITFVSAEQEQGYLSDYRGKYVYLSFWAKWCGKCISEMEASESNRKAAQHPNIEFLFVNVDEDRGDWLNHPSRKSTTGTHVWTPGIKSEAAKSYEIFSLPRYYLIDPNGDFISSFPKASSPEFVSFVQSLSK